MMSATSRGHYVQNEEGKWLHSTVLVVPERWEAPELEAEAEAGGHEAAGLVGEGELVIEEDQPAGPIAPVPHDEPRRRLHGKQAQPSLRPLREGGSAASRWKMR